MDSKRLEGASGSVFVTELISVRIDNGTVEVRSRTAGCEGVAITRHLSMAYAHQLCMALQHVLREASQSNVTQLPGTKPGAAKRKKRKH